MEEETDRVSKNHGSLNISKKKIEYINKTEPTISNRLTRRQHPDTLGHDFGDVVNFKGGRPQWDSGASMSWQVDIDAELVHGNFVHGTLLQLHLSHCRKKCECIPFTLS